MKKALITGATGFIGSHLVRRLNEIKISARIFRRKSSMLTRLEGLQFEDFTGELEEKEALKDALRTCDTFFHLAAGTTLLAKDRESRWKTNVLDLQTVLQAAEEAGVRFVYCSTAGTCGVSREPKVFDERNAGTDAGIQYFVSKKKAEELVLAAARRGLDAVIVNPATVIGPNMREAQQKAFRDSLLGRGFFYPSGGNSFCYVEDVVEGMIAAARNGKKGEIYLLAGHNMSFKEYFEKVSRIGNASPPRFRLNASLPFLGGLCETFASKFGRDFGVLACHFGYYSSEKAKRELGYTITPFEDMVRKTAESL